MHDLTAVSNAFGLASSIRELLELISEKAREVVGAHQAATSLVLGDDWAKAVHAVSVSDKYAAWKGYDERPDGSGIYRLVCQLNVPIRFTQTQLTTHWAWRGFGEAAGRHPPMRGWLAAPLTGRGGRSIGLIQLSDKYDGEFVEADETDEEVLVALAQCASRAIEENRRAARVHRRRGESR